MTVHVDAVISIPLCTTKLSVVEKNDVGLLPVPAGESHQLVVTEGSPPVGEEYHVVAKLCRLMQQMSINK